MNGVKQLRYDIPVNLELPAHKVSLLIQAELGGVDFPVDKDNRSLLEPHHNDRKQVLSKIKRFINCIADIAIARGDSTTLKTALMFNRSVSASGWDDTPMQMKQVEVLKVRMIRGLVARDIKSLEALEHAEQHVIELSCNMPPPFGRKVLDFLGALPKLRVSISLVGKPVSSNTQGR
jgi:ATP-dependent DNA helicase HFM1/MER3